MQPCGAIPSAALSWACELITRSKARTRMGGFFSGEQQAFPRRWPVPLLPSCELSFRHCRLFPFAGIWENISLLFSFPVAAVTNYHKVGGLQKQHKLIVLAPEVGSLTRVSLHGNQGVGGPVHLLGVPREHLCPGLLWLLEAALTLGLWSLPPSSEPAIYIFVLSALATSLSNSPLPPHPLSFQV